MRELFPYGTVLVRVDPCQPYYSTVHPHKNRSFARDVSCFVVVPVVGDYYHPWDTIRSSTVDVCMYDHVPTMMPHDEDSIQLVVPV